MFVDLSRRGRAQVIQENYQPSINARESIDSQRDLLNLEENKANDISESAEEVEQRIQQAAQNRARRGIPADAHEITSQEQSQEIWRLVFCILFDLIGVFISVNIEFFNDESCEMPIKFWFLVYGIMSIISALYNAAYIREIMKLYIAKSSESFSFLIDMQSILLKLIQIIMLTILILICCPLMLFCGYFRNNRPQAADSGIIKNLNKQTFEDFLAFKRFLRIQRNSKRNASVVQSSSSSDIIARNSNVNIDSQPLLQEENNATISPENPYLNIQNDEESDLTCAICLDEFQQGQEVVPLPCKNHSFHLDCIETWLKKNSNCPVCRFKVTKQSLQELKKEIASVQKSIKEQKRLSIKAKPSDDSINTSRSSSKSKSIFK
ncbi:pinus taeda anonymous locus 2_4925_01 genomic sequence [Stylonychia lemnae]|uniref:Pinus taeda anonymous locus 2_4925_01 genomic sequence n=1 Tax=Stylonychia lemnae TaxID=5949 RepID=A0A078AQE3_STYLE|nr:pinus taeda anonymous locus 2_4925_01 genomic sequence [Stylonychia lemnae]|eukprot:CDW83467.1 pinus taeda anonymous locus 2_4925_01 genomic sequence [Stylonychia lemnae]